VAELADAQGLGFCAPHLPKRNNAFQTFQSLYKWIVTPRVKTCRLLPILSNGKVTDKLKKKAASIALGFLLLCQPAIAQERKAYTVPFHAEKGYLLLQTTVEGKPAVLILDTGSPVSFSKGHALQLRLKDGAISFRFDDRNPLSAQYYPPDKIAYDGILGNDLLRQFRSACIDYKAQTVTLED
jgi:hypothetical protein